MHSIKYPGGTLMQTSTSMYPNLYALLECNSNARRLFSSAPPQIRRQLLVRQRQIHSVAALDAAICSLSS